MINFILIIFCIMLGMLIKRLKMAPNDSFKGINAWLLYIALPALVLRYVPEIEWKTSIIIPAISPIIIWFLAILLVSIYAKKMKITPETKTALIVSCGLGNTAFLGFPMISAFYGEESIHYAIVFDQITFILFSTAAVILVLRTKSSQSVGIKVILKKILLFPTFLAALFALLAVPFLDYSIANPFLDKIVATLSPLALFSIGMQMKFGQWRSEAKNIIAALSYKVIIAPAVIFLILLLVGETGNFSKINVFEAAMPAHISASLLASQYELNPTLCNLMVGIGIFVSFFSSTFWYFMNNIAF